MGDWWPIVKKIGRFPLLRTFVFYHIHFRERKWTRAETHGRLNLCTYGYLKSAYWYFGIPPGHGTTCQLARQHTTHHLRVNPQAPGEGEISLPHSRAIFSKLKNEDKDLFSFRNCKKWCKKAQNAIISLSFPSYVNWQPPDNRHFIGERARREVARRGFGSPQAVVYEWIRLSIVLPYTDHLFSMTRTILPRFCWNEAREMVMCL